MAERSTHIRDTALGQEWSCHLGYSSYRMELHLLACRSMLALSTYIMSILCLRIHCISSFFHVDNNDCTLTLDLVADLQFSFQVQCQAYFVLLVSLAIAVSSCDLRTLDPNHVPLHTAGNRSDSHHNKYMIGNNPNRSLYHNRISGTYPSIRIQCTTPREWLSLAPVIDGP